MKRSFRFQHVIVGTLALLAAVALPWVSAAPAQDAPGERLPNFVIIFTDDQGYQDVGCFGSLDIETPNLDRMAAEGMKFTNFYAAQAVCSASRAALMTGCYPNRIGILGALGPNAKHGINAEEMTIAEVVKQRGYATAIYGKWHLGHHPQFLPTRHGFDDYFGLPYSNDMWPHHPTNGKHFPPLPMIEKETVVNADVSGEDQTHLTTRYTERAVEFIKQNETPGLGARIAEEWFKEQFRGKMGPFVLVPEGTAEAEKELDAITGATRTSNFVLEMINQSLEDIKEGESPKLR